MSRPITCDYTTAKPRTFPGLHLNEREGGGDRVDRVDDGPARDDRDDVDRLDQQCGGGWRIVRKSIGRD